MVFSSLRAMGLPGEALTFANVNCSDDRVSANVRSYF